MQKMDIVIKIKKMLDKISLICYVVLYDIEIEIGAEQNQPCLQGDAPDFIKIHPPMVLGGLFFHIGGM